jgi:SAM-dependent methyltransferase
VTSRERQHDRIRDEFTRQAEPLAESAEFTSDSILDRIADAVAARPDDDVLDVACGPGLVAARIACNARSVVGVDITPEMIERARSHASTSKLANLRFEVAPGESLPFADASFDRVVSRLAIHHFAEPAIALREMRRVLRPTGTLTIADVCTSEDAAEANLHNAIETLRDPSHVRMWTPNQLVELARSAGLEAELAREWKRVRSFDEWIAITGRPERIEPLRVVLLALAERGAHCGIGLRLDAGKIRFDHHWVIVSARVG